MRLNELGTIAKNKSGDLLKNIGYILGMTTKKIIKEIDDVSANTIEKNNTPRIVNSRFTTTEEIIEIIDSQNEKSIIINERPGIITDINVVKPYIYHHVAPLFKGIKDIPGELSDVLGDQNLETINLRKYVQEANNLLDIFQCVDCRQGTCKKHNLNLIGSGLGGEMTGFISLLRTKGYKNRRLNDSDSILFESLITKEYLDFCEELPGGGHSHIPGTILTKKMIDTEEKLKEMVSCGAIKNFFRGALFDEHSQLKIKKDDIYALLDIYNISVNKNRLTFLDNKEEHKASHAVLIDHEITYKDIPKYVNQQQIIEHLPTEYTTTVNTKVGDQSAYVLDAKMSHMLLDKRMFDFIDRLRNKNDAEITRLITNIVLGFNFALPHSYEAIYDTYKQILAAKQSNQLENARYNTAINITRFNETIKKGNTIKVTQKQLKKQNLNNN